MIKFSFLFVNFVFRNDSIILIVILGATFTKMILLQWLYFDKGAIRFIEALIIEAD